MDDLLVSMKCRIADWGEEGEPVDWCAYQAEYAEAADTIEALRARVAELEGALGNIADATSAEDDAGENYRWDDREGALDYAYATSRAALGDKA